MFSYIHSFHAGNFADIHKHLTLIAVLEHLQKKPTPFGVLDTHAGHGLYDLQSTEAQKNQEYLEGLWPLLKAPALPELALRFKKVLESYNADDIRFYPGSPAIIAHYLREQDHAIGLEGHPQAVAELDQFLKGNSQFHLHRRDALEGLVALVPLKEKRGLIFIDPSYEVKADYQDVPIAIKNAYKKFSQGVYILWYPLLQNSPHKKLLKNLQAGGYEKMWYCQWIVHQEATEGMFGSGIVIINIPWQIDTQLSETFKYLNKHVFHGHWEQGLL